MKLILLLFIICFAGTAYCQSGYRFCVYPNDYQKCADLDRSGSSVQCVKVQDSVDCALKIKRGEADFGTFYPEQVHLVNHFLGEKAAVISELRPEGEYKNNSFQMVVLVNKDHNSGIEGLRGKKYCHPGLDFHDLWTPRIRKELEYQVLKSNPAKCSDNDHKTCIENEIKNLEQFFGESCRPGPWVQDDDKLDQELKQKYSKLCKLCDAPSACSYNNKDSSDNALRCLKEKNADVAYVSWESAKQTDLSNYVLLCNDGSLNNIPANINRDIPEKCSWRNQPWILVLATSDKARYLKDDLNTWIAPELIYGQTGQDRSRSSPNEWKTKLQNILTRNRADRVKIIDNEQSLNDFLVNKYQKLPLYNNIDANIKWCTVSEEEQEKCEWLSHASNIAGIEPEMKCVQESNVYECLNKIHTNTADLISIDSRLGYLGRKKNLQNLLFNDKSEKDISFMIALLPKSSNVNKFEDLMGKKACFPEHRGLGWISFVEVARRHKIIPNTCNYDKSVSEFFTEICAPGAEDAYHYNSTTTNATKMCALCKGNCDANDSSKYYKDIGALQCLIDNNADVAFLEQQALDTMSETDKQNYKIICIDDTVLDLAQVPEIEQCALSATVDSEVLFRHGDIREKDYKLVLFHMEQLFGTGYKNEKTMEMFKQFNGINNLMFKDSVLGFEDDSSNNKYVQNYKTLFKKVDECFNAAWTSTSSSIALIFSLLFAVLFIHY